MILKPILQKTDSRKEKFHATGKMADFNWSCYPLLLYLQPNITENSAFLSLQLF